MTWFVISRNDEDAPETVDLSRRLFVPPVECTKCGRRWATTGADYPLAGGKLLRKLLSGQSHKVAPPEDAVQEMISQVRDIVPNTSFIGPGSKFGPAYGYVNLGSLDIDLSFSTIVVARRSAVEQLWNVGARFETATVFDSSGVPIDDFVEIVAPPSLQLELPAHLKKGECKACDYQAYQAPKAFVVRQESIPQGTDILRAQQFPTRVFCSERFREGFLGQGLVGLTFQACKII